MSTTEALRTQLVRLEAENQRLREANSLETAVIELGKELVQSQEENVRLGKRAFRRRPTSRRTWELWWKPWGDWIGGESGETTKLKLALAEK